MINKTSVMQSIKNIITVIALIFLFSSCSNEPSLQRYFVDNSESTNFMSFTVPSSLLNVSDTNLTDNEQEALKSIKKLNILAFQIKEDNLPTFKAEKKKITKILQNDKYHELMRINNGKQRGVVKYLGDDDNIDEVIIFGNDNENGFALVRVLGDNMTPEGMLQLVQAVQKSDIDGKGLDKIKQIFSK